MTNPKPNQDIAIILDMPVQSLGERIFNTEKYDVEIVDKKSDKIQRVILREKI